MEKLNLYDVIDIDILQEIQNHFSRATGLAAVTVDYTGTPITKYSNFTRFCNNVRKDPEMQNKCYLSDAHGGLEAIRTGKPYIYECPAGLVDFAVPIVVKGQHLGSIMAGQVKIKNGEWLKGRSILKNSTEWISNDEVIKSYRELSVISYEKIKASAYLMHLVANYIVEKGLISIYQEELNKKNTELLKAIETRLELEKALKSAELKILQSQLSPHFLFNVLNTIGRLALIENATKTEEMVYSFSEMLRYSLKKSTQFVTLSEDIYYVEKYLKIQKTRFSDRLSYSIEVPKEILDFKVPFMTVQPFVENAINHGLGPKEEGGYIRVVGKILKDDIIIKILDNGIGMSKIELQAILENIFSDDFRTNSTGIGIKNVNDRLVNYFGEKYNIKIHSQEDKGTVVRITIPKITNSRSALNV